MKLHSNTPLILIWAVIFVILFWDLGGTPLTDIDEGAFAEATREMWVRSDFISPWLLDAPRFDKPVLIHWLQMISMLTFGFNSLGARIPSAIAGLFWILAIALWAKIVASKISDSIDVKKVFLWALVISASSVAIPAISRSSTADATLNAFICWAIYFQYRGLTARELQVALREARYAAACVGCGLLTKGPIAVLVPGVVLLIGWWAFCRQESNDRLKKIVFDVWSWIMVICITLPWYWLQYQAQGDAFLRGFFGVHNLGRFVNAMHGFTAGPWYYPVWLLVAILPFSAIFVHALISLRKNKVLLNRYVWPCWGNLIFVIIFFSFSATKLPHYGFYGLPGLIVVLAIFLTTLSTNSLVRPLSHIGKLPQQLLFSRFAIAAVFVVVIAFPLSMDNITAYVMDPYAKSVLDTATSLLEQKVWLFIGFGLLGVLFLFSGRLWFALMPPGLLFSLMMHLLVIPIGIEAYRGPVRDLAREISLLQIDVSTWRFSSPSLSFELGRIATTYQHDGNQHVVLLTKNAESFRSWLESERHSRVRLTTLWNKGGIMLLRIN